MSPGETEFTNARTLGWTDHESARWDTVPAGSIPARIITRYSSSWRAIIPSGFREVPVEAAGAFHYLCAGPEDYPVVGDWVALSPEGGLIQQLLPRRTTITRQEPGRAARAQVLVSNVDSALLVFGLDGHRNYSIGLLERFLTLSAAGGVEPVVVLNKADCASPERIEIIQSEVESVRPGTALCVTSVPDGRGLEELRNLIPPGSTACCLGRSGVGKSSIINALLDERSMRTAEVSRVRNRGRHTTTNSQLRLLPGGGMLIDTPGLRELQLWGAEDSLHGSFPEILEHAPHCRFRDCRHQGEPGCAVQQAVAEGIIPHQRLDHYLEQRDELATADLRSRMNAASYEKRRWKKISRTGHS
ncbi:MAG: ribosome small subunit-dependent GTPase A [Spirochaetaceae bacterium]|nr:MAG: ribosome small subunit-dependent GTPase A [Spirochaetaceae bacterium]